MDLWSGLAAVSVVHVAHAIEAGVKRAHEVVGAIIDGGRDPSLGIVTQLVGQDVLPGQAAQRCYDVDEEQREGDVADAAERQVTDRAKPGVEGDRIDDKTDQSRWHEQHEFDASNDQSQNR
jgi:hypothetical protein